MIVENACLIRHIVQFLSGRTTIAQSRVLVSLDEPTQVLSARGT
ncbi:hypothetical protein [Ktedonobacter racemifer]|nr:hypothetical protein [Ktedonobacter racemifer]